MNDSISSILMQDHEVTKTLISSRI